MVAAYNAGPSRAVEWNKTETGARPLSADEFIARIDISSTRAYVTNILTRYRNLKEQKAAGNRQKAESRKPKAAGSQRSALRSFPPAACCLLPTSTGVRR